MSTARGLKRLQALPVVPAAEFFTRSPHIHPSPTAVANQSQAQILDEHEYHFCKKLIDCPLLPSSQYPKLLRVSSKTAVEVRRRLVERGLIHERRVDQGGRGRSTILLEASKRGREAVAAYEAATGQEAKSCT